MDKRIEALRSGAPRYVSELPCRNCGGLARYATSNNCVACSLAASKKKYAAVKLHALIPEVPPCLMLPGSDLCTVCDRAATCAGNGKRDVLARAKHAFPDHPPVPAAAARKLGMAICKPVQACAKCGTLSWRRIGARYCLGCFERKLHLAQ